VLLVHCVGTGTDVGKTWVGAATLADLRHRRLAVSARKPVQSFDASESGPTDAAVLAAATGEHPDDVCPARRWYGVPMAPPMAADVLGRPRFTVEELLADVRWPEPAPALGWLEGVGGPRSPVADDGDGVDLCRLLRPDVVVLVGDAGLGTINAVVLSCGPYAALGHDPIVMLNRYDDEDDLHRRNRAWLTERWHLDIVVRATELADRLAARL
jgi:dethiobiotin synthetase